MRNFFISLCLSLCICLVGCCDTNKSADNNKRIFIPRLTAPDKNNRCFYSDNIFYKSGFGMPNCTAYAWGRAYELLKKKPRLCLSDACNWYSYNSKSKIYPFGNRPKLGAIACFDNKYGGHVAVVERISKNTVTFSNSAYNGKLFYLTYASIKEKNPCRKDWDFKGYIYII